VRAASITSAWLKTPRSVDITCVGRSTTNRMLLICLNGTLQY
jgi:hypothetical protein